MGNLHRRRWQLLCFFQQEIQWSWSVIDYYLSCFGQKCWSLSAVKGWSRSHWYDNRTKNCQHTDIQALREWSHKVQFWTAQPFVFPWSTRILRASLRPLHNWRNQTRKGRWDRSGSSWPRWGQGLRKDRSLIYWVRAFAKQWVKIHHWLIRHEVLQW